MKKFFSDVTAYIYPISQQYEVLATNKKQAKKKAGESFVNDSGGLGRFDEVTISAREIKLPNTRRTQ